MLLPNIRLAFRNLLNQRLSSAINIFGLVAGLTTALFVLLYILNELSYDKFHKKGNRIYRIIENNHIHQWIMATTPFPLAEAIVAESPAVEQSARVNLISQVTIRKDRQWLKEENMYAADASIFNMFSFEVIAGDAAALSEPNSAVLTGTHADKYFGGKDPLQQTMEINLGDTVILASVVAVIKDLPQNVTFRPGIILSMDLGLVSMSKSLITTGGESPAPEDIAIDWDFNFFTTYALLKPEADTSQVIAAFRSLERDHYGEELKYSFLLQPLRDIYLGSGHLINADTPMGDWQNIFTFSGIGLLIIIISALNYILLYGGQTALRSKEYGIRKVIGASRGALLSQVIIESILVVLLVLPVCLALVEVFRPAVSQFLGKNLVIEEGLGWQYPLGFSIITLLVGLVPGISIISYISRIPPVIAMEGTKIIGRGQPVLNIILVSCQFIIFNILMICSLGIFQQIQYTHKKDLGYDWQNLITVKLEQGSMTDHFDVVKNELLAFPGIENITGGMFTPPTNSVMSFHTKKLDGSEDEINLEAIMVDPDFLETMGIRMTDGRSLSSFDNYDSWKIALNRKAVDLLGAEEPVGTKIFGGEIVGIIGEFNYHSFHKDIPPMIVIASKNNLRQMIIRVKNPDNITIQSKIESIIRKIIPGSTPVLTFMEDQIKTLYEKERKTAGVVGIFTGIAIVIGAMGLFGMSMHILQRRRREFAIRKVNGAHVGHIIRLLSRQYILLIVSTLAIASPPALLLLNRWLQNYVFRINVSWKLFSIAGAAGIIIVLITLGYHVSRAATRNPSESLRYE
jgi:putative ABC transport system permease protein